MNTPNEDGKQAENAESSPKEQGAGCCGPGCGCEGGAKPGKARWVVGVIVLAAAGVLVVRGMVKSDSSSTSCCPAGFANPVAAQSAAGGAEAPADATAAAESSVGTSLGAFSELNTAAAKTDAVFVFIPAKEGTSARAPSATMQAAARTIEAKGMKCGLFTLKPGSADYDQIARQVTVPGVLALVKGRGMSAVSGDITEAKLVQGIVAASTPSCGPSASPGCCPK